MSTRFKFKGTPFSIPYPTRDDGSFKESEHPRNASGQFSSSGGAGGKQIHGGVTAPKKGTVAHSIWTYAALCEEKGIPVNAQNVVSEAAKAGVTINMSSAQQTMSPFKKYQAAAKAAGAQPMKAEPSVVKPEAPKLENNLETFEGVAASGGLTKEGIYGAVTYYKNSSGLKASYSPESKSWQVKNPDGTVKKGEGMEELAKELSTSAEKVEAMKAHQATQAAAAKVAAEAAAKAQKESAHSTKNAALYGHREAVKGEHTYTTKGAATETGFAKGIRESIQAYKGSSYKPINKAMRFDTDYSSASADTLRHVLNLQRAFRLAPPTTQDIQVGRKVEMEALKTMAKDAGLESLKDLQPGQVLRDEGVMSTSHSAGVWSGSVKFDITVPKGSKAIDLSETMNPGESELMLPPGSGLKIKEVKHDHKGHSFYIICEHVT